MFFIISAILIWLSGFKIKLGEVDFEFEYKGGLALIYKMIYKEDM